MNNNWPNIRLSIQSEFRFQDTAGDTLQKLEIVLNDGDDLLSRIVVPTKNIERCRALRENEQEGKLVATDTLGE